MPAALRGAAGRYFQGRTVRAGLSGDLTQQPHSGDRRSRRSGRTQHRGVRVGRHPAISRTQDREILSARRACAHRGGRVAVLADGRSRSHGRASGAFSPLRAGAALLRDCALHRRGQPPLRRDEHAAWRSANFSPTATRSPTSPASAGCVLPSDRDRISPSFRISSAGTRRSAPARRSSARSPSTFRRHRRSIRATRRCAPSCSVSARDRGAWLSAATLRGSKLCDLQNTMTQPFSSAVFASGHGERARIGLAVLGVVDLAVPFVGRAAWFHAENDLHAEQRPVALRRVGIFVIGLRPSVRVVWLLEPDQRAAQRAPAFADADLAVFRLRCTKCPKDRRRTHARSCWVRTPSARRLRAKAPLWLCGSFPSKRAPVFAKWKG